MTTADTTRQTLKLLREHFGDLMAAQYTDPHPVWPPQRLTTEMWAVRDAQARAERAERTDLALGDAPAPIANLTAFDAVRHITTALGELADIVAASCQLPIGDLPVPTTHPALSAGWIPDPRRAEDPRRWHLTRTETSPHWAAVYIDGRLADEDLDDGLFRRMPVNVRRECAEVIGDCWRQTASVLGIGERHVEIPDRPCPWCGGVLMLHQIPDESPAVSCETGKDCTAPVERDVRGHARWDWRHLGALAGALDARARGAA